MLHANLQYSKTLGIPARHLSFSSRPTSSFGGPSQSRWDVEVRTPERVAPGCRDPEALFLSSPKTAAVCVICCDLRSDASSRLHAAR